MLHEILERVILRGKGKREGRQRTLSGARKQQQLPPHKQLIDTNVLTRVSAARDNLTSDSDSSTRRAVQQQAAGLRRLSIKTTR